MNKIIFGTAGIPNGAKPRNSYDKIFAYLKKRALTAMELEFVRGVNINEERAEIVKENAEKFGITLTAHAPFYINLNAIENEKVEASKTRIIDTAVAASNCGALSITFHAGFFLGQESDLVYTKIKHNLECIMEEIYKREINLDIRPELTGKQTQFGSLDELIKLSEDIKGVYPCVDFSHYIARYAGKTNTYEDFVIAIEKLKKHGYHKFLHMHISGIEYTPKGERRHNNLSETESLKYKELLQALKENNVGGIVICESPNLEEDAVLLKSYYDKLNSEGGERNMSCGKKKAAPKKSCGTKKKKTCKKKK